MSLLRGHGPRHDSDRQQDPARWAIASGATNEHVDIVRAQRSRRLHDRSLEDDRLGSSSGGTPAAANSSALPKSRAPCPRQPARPSCRPGRNSAPTTGRELCRSAAAVPMIATGFAVLGFAASAAGNDILSAREHSLRPLHRLIGVGGRDRQGRVLRLCLELQQPVQGRRQIGASTTSSREF